MFFWERPRPQKRYEIRKCNSGEWAKFRRYHYLNSDLPSAAICYGVYDDEKIIAFMAVLHQPHNVNKKIKRVCRLVVLPDYQGVGLGNSFLSKTCALHFKEKNKTISITTSLLRFANSIKKNKDFICFHCGSGGKNKRKQELNKTQRFKYISFKYLPSTKS